MKRFFSKRSIVRNCLSVTSKVALTAILVFTFTACNEQDLVLDQENPLAAGAATTLSDTTSGLTELPGISYESVLEILATFGNDVITVIFPILEALDVPGDVASTFLRTFKVSTPFPNPDGSGTMIDISGVVIVPVDATDSLRFIISTPPTYTENTSAPSNIFSGELPLFYEDFLNYQYFFAINAAQGCAIFIPDYPGYGDSYQQCFHPYLVKEALVNSTIALAQVAREGLAENGYLLKKENLITGYSQGGFVATATGRELDLNGDSYGLPINLLVSGGTPANITIVKNIARGDQILSIPQFYSLPLSFVYPYAILGYKENGNPDLEVSDLINSPYDEGCYEYLNGQYSVTQVLTYFPLDNLGLFTDDFLLDNQDNASVAMLDSLVAVNSIDPWVNNVPVKFIHGLIDEAVYYENITDFIDRMEDLGGTPDLYTNPVTEHLLTLVDYYVQIAGYITEYK
ncbi:MAG: hypothetical protein LIP06_10960 [Tannerellaceae bacterium]|nr:hypothetical protein [Tannerellaceae bacterium]